MKESEFTNAFAQVVSFAAHRQTDAAASILSRINQLGTLNAAGSVSKAREAAILARDRYTCRYCNFRLISLPVMRAVSVLFPTLFKYHQHWKAVETDVAFWRNGTSLDHVCPVTRGGTSKATNLVASCWPCNFSKGNLLLSELGRDLLSVSTSDWDGLSGHLGDLVDQMESPEQYFLTWRQAIENPEPLAESA